MLFCKEGKRRVASLSDTYSYTTAKLTDMAFQPKFHPAGKRRFDVSSLALMHRIQMVTFSPISSLTLWATAIRGALT